MASIRPFNDGDIEHAIVPGDVVRDHDLQKKNVTSDQITSSAWLQRWTGCDFPLFSDEIMESYHEHNVSNVNPFIFTPIILVHHVFIACRSGLMGVRFGKFSNLLSCFSSLLAYSQSNFLL